MTYDINAILEGIATVLYNSGYEDIYISNQQQNVKTPCFFISMMPGSIRDEVDGRYIDDMGFDVTFLQNPNVVNSTDAIYEVLAYLNEHLDYIPYTDDAEVDPIPMHTYERNYNIQDMDLHYTFHIKNHIRISTTYNYMLTMEGKYEIKRS